MEVKSKAFDKRMNSSTQIVEESGLIAAILAGDNQLYNRLIVPHQQALQSMSLLYTKNWEEAQDVAQETLIRAFQSLRAFRGDSKFRTWLMSIAINEARSRLRRRAAIRVVSLDELQDGEAFPRAILEDQRELPSAVIERDQIMRQIEWAVGMLPNIYRQVYLLRDVEERTINETAKILEINPSLVKVRLHRARRMLRGVLQPKLKTIAKVKWRLDE